MMAAILNSTILDSATLVIFLSELTQKHFPRISSHYSDTKKSSLIHSDSTWWWQPSWILPYWIQTPCYLLSDSLKNTLYSTLTLTQTNSIWLKLIHSDSTWWWQHSWILPSWILPSWIQPFCSKLWHSKLIQSDSKSFILTQLDDGSHLEFCHFAHSKTSLIGFRHLVMMAAQIHSKTLPLLDLPFCTKKLHSFILTQLDDSSHLEFCHLEFCHLGFSHFSFSSLKLAKIGSHSHFTHSFWLNLMMAAILKSAIFQPFCTKRTSLIHSDSTWWWQPSWILPCWIQTLPSWIQTPCYLLSDSLKNTLTPFWLWLKLIQSDSNSFILT